MANITGWSGRTGCSSPPRCGAAARYLVGDKHFPSANVDERDLRRVLARGFSPRVEVRHLEGHEAQGYSGIVLAAAPRRPRGLRPARGLRSGVLVSGG